MTADLKALVSGLRVRADEGEEEAVPTGDEDGKGRRRRPSPVANIRAKRAVRRTIAGEVISLANLLGRPVLDTDGTRVGRVSDVVVRWDAGTAYPRVSGVLVSLGKGFALVGSRDVTIEQTKVRSRSAELLVATPVRQEGDIALARDVLDHQLVDIDGVQVVRAADVYLRRGCRMGGNLPASMSVSGPWPAASPEAANLPASPSWAPTGPTCRPSSRAHQTQDLPVPRARPQRPAPSGAGSGWGHRPRSFTDSAPKRSPRSSLPGPGAARAGAGGDPRRSVGRGRGAAGAQPEESRRAPGGAERRGPSSAPGAAPDGRHLVTGATSPEPSPAAPRVRKRWVVSVLAVLAILGPGLIAANAGNDAGGILTYASAGSQFGYRMLFLMVLITVALVVVQEMCSRLGVFTGEGLGGLIREQFSVRSTFGACRFC